MQTPLGLVHRNRKHIRKIKGESSEHQVHNEEFMDIVYLPDIDNDVTIVAASTWLILMKKGLEV